MYVYDEYDQRFVETRSLEFRRQVARRISGELSEEEFKPLRLMNGLYLQLHAYMLRVAIPYGVLSSKQLRKLGFLAKHYDRDYGHFTTRQNIQFNWIKLSDVPDILDHLSSVQMHAIQTSGNCIRNITTDAFAGVAFDEWVDPRPTAELLRQWSSLHPEFAFLPRKFKIAVIGAPKDRAAMKFHDIGLWVKPDSQGNLVYDIWVGGGQGRTPRVAKLFAKDIIFSDLLPMLDSMLRIYNLYGRRDNKYKARIKILIAEMGIQQYQKEVLEEFKKCDASLFKVAQREYRRIFNQFYESQMPAIKLDPIKGKNKKFNTWLHNNVSSHKTEGYAIVSISLKNKGAIPGDATGAQMTALADIAETYSNSEIRVSHRQNLVLPWVRIDMLQKVYDALVSISLAESNINLASDIIACPGLDYCSLATARSIPVAKTLSRKLREREKQADLSNLTLNISGCINACGHHHAANIGILGLNRAEKENYQITLGGSNDEDASIGDILGPGFSQEDVPKAIESILNVYENYKTGDETFIQVYKRIGKIPFKEAVYVDSR